MDQIYNHMAKIHFESGGNVRVPMVLTTAAGGGYSDAEQHSQCLWGTFAHLPGMKVVVPSNPADAKGLMISAIRDDNPVVYMFHKGVMGLPWMAKNPRSIAPVPEEPYETPIGKAAVARGGHRRHRGDPVPVGAPRARRGREELAERRHGPGGDRPAQPGAAGHGETVLSSVAKTGRLLVVDEDYQSFGLSGEIAARVAETDPGLLRSPVRRVAVPDVPIPYARSLEQRGAADAGADRGGRPRAGQGLSMAEVLFPRLSEEEPDAEGVLATWFVSDGDQVASGQLLAEVMVEKVVR